MNTNIIYDYKFITTAGTTSVYPAACTLGRLIFGTALAGTVDIYDANNAATTPVAHFSAGSVGNTYAFDITMAFGITVVTSSSSDDITITYKRT